MLHLESRRSSVVEQLIRNQQVGGSIPLVGSIKSVTYDDVSLWEIGRLLSKETY